MPKIDPTKDYVVEFLEANKTLQRIDQKFLSIKSVLTFEETMAYTGLSKGQLQKLVRDRIVPHSIPTGREVFFDRVEIDKWLLSKPAITKHDMEQAAKEWIRKGTKTGPRIRNKRTN